MSVTQLTCLRALFRMTVLQGKKTCPLDVFLAKKTKAACTILLRYSLCPYTHSQVDRYTREVSLSDSKLAGRREQGWEREWGWQNRGSKG